MVTGLAYGLAFFAIAISPVSTFSLVAVALLGVSMVAALRVQPWYHLGLAGVIGSYLCFALWGESVGFRSGGLSDDNFLVGVATLGIYWLMFAVSALVRRPATADERTAILVLSVFNAVGFLGFGVTLAHHGVEPSKLHAFTLLAAIAFAGMAYMHRRVQLHASFLLHALVAVALVASGVPLHLEPRDISYDWLALPWAAGGRGGDGAGGFVCTRCGCASPDT